MKNIFCPYLIFGFIFKVFTIISLTVIILNMTIKARNRITLILSTITIVFSILVLAITLFLFLSGKITWPSVYLKNTSDSFLLRYKPIYVVISIFIEYFYIIFTSLMIRRAFEKTQASDMLFFLLFLIACLCDTCRIAPTLFHISQSYTNTMIKIGNFTLLARLLAPLALFGTTVLSSDEFKQNTEYYALILLIIALFFSFIIPTNTAQVLPNFCLSYGYLKLIRSLSFIMCFVSTISILISTIKNKYKPIMIIGFILICIGYTIMFNSYNLLSTIAGPLVLGTGTFMYLSEVHNHYLFID